MKLDNFIKTKMDELNLTSDQLGEYDEFYEDFNNENIKIIFSYLHSEYIRLFKQMNSRLPTGENTAHFWAEPSRELINVIETTFEMLRILKKTEFAFEVDRNHMDIITKCRGFLSVSGGSVIPAHMEKIELYYTNPIFMPSNIIIVKNEIYLENANLKFTGEGSYANVYKYKDKFYNKSFAVKRAKKELNQKELERFKREFEVMSEFSSPYIVEVYGYDENNNQYVMEYADYTLDKYMEKYTSSMSLNERKNAIFQLLRGYEYIHSKSVLHRDVSFKNVLVKKYDDVVIFKISDFGLVKIEDIGLTSINTAMKGSLNDPSLKTKGFTNYDLLDEIYALTLLFVYILSGKQNFANIKEQNIRSFMEKGTNPDRTKRFQNLSELRKGIEDCVNAISKEKRG